MSISVKYHKIRKGLGFWASAIFIVAFLLGFAFTSNGNEAEQASFAYNVGIVIAILWVYASGIAKFLMMEGRRGYKTLNISALALLAFFVILVTQIPGSPSIVQSSTLHSVWAILTTLWFISWGVLDICEIVF